MNDYLYVGKIANTHGLKGELKIKSDTDFKEERYKTGSKLYLSSGDEMIELEVATHRVHKNYDLVKFKGLDNINDVEQYKGCTVHVHESQLDELDDGDYYYNDLIGSAVYGNDYIGIVKDVLNHGASDLLVIKRESKKEVMIPFVEEFVETVDLEKKEIKINEIEGLID
ncbi:ribosome maturation factor RimM [Haloplasma contractile]|uniref:Ribosome maturation factor RimM n=1 Tax=Haloplasma contractile SSD-17B TaxID=1033810 RepID=U2FR87_9MOLU|nr:ribosome maturation factor RimM [Haloplasma contractile]ERJ13494.1 Ribosome maturation factor RimM protein [Haloplasma contractile SSD-17B]